MRLEAVVLEGPLACHRRMSRSQPAGFVVLTSRAVLKIAFSGMGLTGEESEEIRPPGRARAQPRRLICATRESRTMHHRLYTPTSTLHANTSYRSFTEALECCSIHILASHPSPPLRGTAPR